MTIYHEEVKVDALVRLICLGWCINNWLTFAIERGVNKDAYSSEFAVRCKELLQQGVPVIDYLYASRTICVDDGGHVAPGRGSTLDCVKHEGEARVALRSYEVLFKVVRQADGGQRLEGAPTLYQTVDAIFGAAGACVGKDRAVTQCSWTDFGSTPSETPNLSIAEKAGSFYCAIRMDGLPHSRPP